MRRALELAQAFSASLYVCSAFDVEYHHVVFHNIKDVLSVQASKVFKFEEQEELHNNIIDKGLLKLCQANLKRAEVMAQEFPEVEVKTQILVGKPFQVSCSGRRRSSPPCWSSRGTAPTAIEGTDLGSQADNLVRLAPCNLLLVGTEGIRPEDIPWIEEDGQAGLPWAPEAEVRILRVPPFAQGIARRAVEEYVLEKTGGETATVTNKWLDEAIAKLLPTHMQLIMGIGSAEEIALAEIKAEEQLKATKVEGHDDDPVPAGGRGRDEVPDHRAGGAPAAGGHRPHRLDRGGLGAPPRRPAHRAAARPQHRRALRPQPRHLARHHPGHGREQAGHDRGRRVRRRDDDGDVQRAAGQADPGGGRGRERPLARDAAVHRGGQGARASPAAPSATSRRRWTSARWTSRR